jgi:hypothetical protein
MKTAVDLIEGLQYKLLMIGIKVDGPANLLCDNKAVVTYSTKKPESTVTKMHNNAILAITLATVIQCWSNVV